MLTSLMNWLASTPLWKIILIGIGACIASFIALLAVVAMIIIILYVIGVTINGFRY